MLSDWLLLHLWLHVLVVGNAVSGEWKVIGQSTVVVSEQHRQRADQWSVWLTGEAPDLPQWSLPADYPPPPPWVWDRRLTATRSRPQTHTTTAKQHTPYWPTPTHVTWSWWSNFVIKAVKEGDLIRRTVILPGDCDWLLWCLCYCGFREWSFYGVRSEAWRRWPGKVASLTVSRV